MKKLALTANAAMLLVAAASLASCSGNSTTTSAAAPAAAVEGEASSSALNIRFIDADSVTSRYVLAQEFQELTLSAVSRIESVGQARQAEIQKLGSQIEQKVRNNTYLSQESYEADMNKFNQMQTEAASTIERMQRQAQLEMAQRQDELNDSLDSAIKAYNAEKGYDAILFKAAGVYFSPALDITGEIITLLNERYQKGKKK